MERLWFPSDPFCIGSVFTYISSNISVLFLLNFCPLGAKVKATRNRFSFILVPGLIIVLILEVYSDSTNSKQDELRWYIIQNCNSINLRMCVWYSNFIQVVKIACTLHTKIRGVCSFALLTSAPPNFEVPRETFFLLFKFILIYLFFIISLRSQCSGKRKNECLAACKLNAFT